jgi:hypothetical protein
MPTHKANADEWSLDQVVHELRRQAGADGVADAHVFLDDSLVGDVDGLAHNLVRTARQRSGSGQKPISARYTTWRGRSPCGPTRR